MSHQSIARHNMTSKKTLRTRWDPRHTSALNHTDIHLCQHGTQSEHAQHQEPDLQHLEPYEDTTKVTRLEHSIEKDDDSTFYPNRLPIGTTIDGLSDELPDNTEKPPSSQELAKLRWETIKCIASGRSKTRLQIMVPGRESSRLVPKSPLLHEESTGYIHSSSSSGSRKSINSFGAIGDQRSRRPGPSSASLVSQCAEQLPNQRSQRSVSIDDCQPSPLYDLLDDPIPNLEGLGAPICNENLSDTQTQSERDAQWSPRTHGHANSGQFKYRTLQDLVDDSIPDCDQYEPVVVGEPTSLNKITMQHKGTPLEQWVGTRRTLLTTNLEDVPVPKPSDTEETSLSSTSSQTPATFASSASNSPLSVENTSKSQPIIAPVWRRRGPPFASSIQTIATPRRRARFGNPSPRPALLERSSNNHNAFLDKLDQEEFCLPYGSIVYSMKSSNITNLQISITKSIWTSTLGSNIVLTEAWERKKPEEKIILLFSITHSVKYSGKYLGMAEMIGPLDLQANCEFWAERKNGIRGLIPVRWIVTKDVPFSRFSDLKYHEQHITQVRHGNTIPGEVGRLVIQRYFESVHGPTATLHPLRQSFQSAEAPGTQDTQSPTTGRNTKGNSVPHQHEGPRGGLATFRRGRGGLRCAGSIARCSKKWSPKFIDHFTSTADLNSKDLPQPVLGSFRTIGRPQNTLSLYGQPTIQGALTSTLEKSVIPGRDGFPGTGPGNSYGNLLQKGDRQAGEHMGSKQRVERDYGKRFARERMTSLR